MEVRNMYCTVNFKTKKELKAAVEIGHHVTLQDGPITKATQNGTEFVEGPWYPAQHSWYATVTMKDGKVIKVK